MTSYRSAKAIAYRRLYQTAQWRRLREAQLSAHPLCSFCLARGRTTEAKVVDHVIPHRGDRDLFFDPKNLDSVCAPCHDSLKAQVESKGYHAAFGLDGFPIDGRHPFYQR